MAPYFNKYADKDSDNSFYMKYSVYLRKIDDEFKKRLRYSLEKGFEEREELEHSPHSNDSLTQKTEHTLSPGKPTSP